MKERGDLGITGSIRNMGQQYSKECLVVNWVSKHSTIMKPNSAIFRQKQNHHETFMQY